MLDAWAARTCAVKTWNRFAPGVEQPNAPDLGAPDESLRDSFDGGLSFSDRVLEALATECRLALTDLRPMRAASGTEQQVACLDALAHGDPVVVAGLLPLDQAGHRSGRADLWIRGADRADGRPGYHPVVVARRQVTERRQPGERNAWQIRVSSLADPAYATARVEDNRAVRGRRDGVLLQVAHYWRLLEAAGHLAEGPPVAGIIGTDEYTEPGHVAITWVPLDEPLVRTFSRSSESGWALRTVLERYDHEHGFRVTVAENARAGGEPIVIPIRNRECESCIWWEICRPKLGADDLSVRIDKAPLDVREISTLRRLGIRSITDLATTDLAELKPRYLPEVRHRTAAEKRLETAAHRARLMLASVDLERITTGPIEVPAADIEIDLDIETAADERVYLWGFLIDDTRTEEPPVFVQFSAWQDLTPAGEAALARRAMGWLQEQLTGPASVRVYHYSAYEVVRLQQLVESSGDPVLAESLAYATAEWCDLFLIMRDHWFGTQGLGLKVVASLGAGFEWRDSEPGGLNSQGWFDEAVHARSAEARAAARQRVLDYNEDDVRATWQLRKWLRDQG